MGGAWNRKNPLMYLRSKEEERKRWEVKFCGVCFFCFLFRFEIKILSNSHAPLRVKQKMNIFHLILNLSFFFFFFSQNDTEQETEKDEAPGSPASYSGSPHHYFLFALLMEEGTQLHIDLDLWM